MNAYFFSAEVTEYRMRPAFVGNFRPAVERLDAAETCAELIVYGDGLEEAQEQFKSWIGSRLENEKPVQTEIKRIVVAPFVNQLFTESGHEPIDWPQISAKVEASLAAPGLDDFEQGYWADVNQLVPADKLPADVESLRRELPEEISSGLNWSSDKLFFFIVSVLSPRISATRTSNEGDTIDLRTGAIRRAEPSEELNLQESDNAPAMFPQMGQKKAAALVQARNSAVAAWRWRKFTAAQGLPVDEIRIDPWCGAVAVEIS
jgi:hypothetical protein